MGNLYFDNAASSWPKPPEVMDAVCRHLLGNGANPGRGSHRMAVEAGRVLFDCRKQAAALFGIRNPNDISFTLNTTGALNTAILGYVREGDHVVCTSVEHNSVRRPLEWLKRHRGVRVDYVETDASGRLDARRVEQAATSATRLFVCNHSSNLLGSILPIAEIAAIARRRGAALLVDAAQTAGVLPIDVQELGIDMLAFPGHKSLLGPQGTGGLYIAPQLEVEPLLYGGTGSQSERADQPDVRPDRYEAGTQNTPGLAGLAAGIRCVREMTVAAIGVKEQALTRLMMDLLQAVPGLKLLGPPPPEPRTPIVAFTVDGIEAAELAHVLDSSFGIAVRAGYHCTPLAHETAGTLAAGAVRASIGICHDEADVQAFADALTEVCGHLRRI